VRGSYQKTYLETPSKMINLDHENGVLEVAKCCREVTYKLNEHTSCKGGCLWDVASYSLAEIYQRFTAVYCLHYQGLMMEAVSTSETRINFC
jgi:hypothetical protein